MKPVQPVYTLDLFPPLSQELHRLLHTLQPDEWSRPTVCGSWTVKDVAAHLLGGNFGRLWDHSHAAEAGRAPAPTPDFETLLEWINQGNALWVQAAQRISPGLLIDLLELTDLRLYEYFSSLSMDSPGRVSVAWAGESISANWFDVAREYTEKWLHQQHIRQAVQRPLLLEWKWLYPVLDTFLRALPYTYRGVDARPGTRVGISISGEAGGEWTLHKESSGWRLYSGRAPQVEARVQLDSDLAWRLFTRGIDQEQAQRSVQITGSAALALPTLDMVSIMA